MMLIKGGKNVHFFLALEGFLHHDFAISYSNFIGFNVKQSKPKIFKKKLKKVLKNVDTKFFKGIISTTKDNRLVTNCRRNT